MGVVGVGVADNNCSVGFRLRETFQDSGREDISNSRFWEWLLHELKSCTLVLRYRMKVANTAISSLLSSVILFLV